MRRIFAMACVFVASACSVEIPIVEPMPPFRHQSFYDTMRAHADHFTIIDGDWREDYGDAAFYGLAFYAHTTTASTDPMRFARVETARSRAITLLDGADLVNGDINEYVMSAFGLLDAIEGTGDTTGLEQLDDFIFRLDALVAALGYYLEGLEGKSWAFDAYGTTAVSALIGLLNAQYAYARGGEIGTTRTEWARQMASVISERAWNGTTYDFGGRDIACIYPNVAMILLNARLYQLTGDAAYRTRAVDTYRGIQVFKLPGEPVRYRSPYSAEVMGAKTDEYFTLSSQNYLALALMTLGEITADPAYVREADSVFDNLSEKLQGSWCLSHRHIDACLPACASADVCVVDACTPDACHGGVLHHWMDGRAALPADPEYFCSGCNLQLLYGLWYRQNRWRDGVAAAH